ncbi:hypothetical protein BDZ85DRAFT_254294 [Elsinoe ampelina]|uniref:Uncharacterized protein n=1 Tax=Elsinoe ampelina TaxID=302913 RepID=A0A6A6GNT9_9PEZI|nr:hypothetical protein BDZ85DRAFT_254294 [Elsinoe ampelina]
MQSNEFHSALAGVSLTPPAVRAETHRARASLLTGVLSVLAGLHPSLHRTEAYPSAGADHDGAVRSQKPPVP